MNEQPRTVVCTSCSAKFHVPDELIRGKLVKFRCRKCGEPIHVDGRRSAQPAAPSPRAAADIAPLDTPAAFSQRTLPPPRPPMASSASSQGLHPWPEPPRTRSTAPTAHSPSAAPPPEESSARFEAVREPSNRGPKIAAVVALLVAAGLSGVGLDMRSTPGSSPGILVHNMPATPPSDPADPASLVAERAAGAATEGDPSQASRSPTRVTDLPVAIAVDGVDPAPPAAAPLAPKPGDPLLEKKDPPASRGESPAPPMARTANNEAPAVVAAPAHPAAFAPAAVPGEEPGETPPPPAVASVAVANAPRTTAPTAPAALANTTPPNPPAAQPATPAPAAPPAPARAANKGDFNTQAAREALEDAAVRAAKCKTIDSPSGTARIAVTFAPNGQATNAVIESGPFVGTAAGTCVASKFRTARVPAFTGEAVQVHKSIPF